MAAPDRDYETVCDTPATSHNVEALEPDTQYRFRVCACSSAGASALSPTAAFSTLALPPGSPEALTCSAQLPSRGQGAAKRRPSLVLEWRPAAQAPGVAIPSAYDVMALPVAGTSSAHKLSANAKTRRAVLKGAEYDTAYEVRVRAVGPGQTGHSEWCAAEAVATPAQPPALPPIVPPSAAAIAALQNAQAPGLRCSAPRGSAAASDAGSETSASTRGRGGPGSVGSCGSRQCTPRSEAGPSVALPASSKATAATPRRPGTTAAAPTAKLPSALKRRRALRGLQRRIMERLPALLLLAAFVTFCMFKISERWLTA
jgi:hypothetical protein